MAKNLIWKDLSAEQIEQIRHPHPKKGLTGRDWLAKLLDMKDKDESKNAINLDLFTQTLRFGESLQFSDDKLSGLFSIVKETHLTATGQRLQIDNSFKMFKDLLLRHSLQRPPYSVGLFTLAEMKTVLQWMLDTYYRHYKLYQYAFTDRVLMSVTQTHPMDIVETMAQMPMQPLCDAMTEEQHMEVVSEEQRKAEEAARAQAEADAEAAEAERQARLREEYIAAVPDEVRDQVSAAVERELALLKQKMEEQFQEQQAALQARLDELEGKAA